MFLFFSKKKFFYDFFLIYFLILTKQTLFERKGKKIHPKMLIDSVFLNEVYANEVDRIVVRGFGEGRE